MSETVLELRNITKVYNNGVVANKDISISFWKGEIHAIVGENGAGKSTLMKMIYGIEAPSSGQIFYKGKERHFKGSVDAIKSGIGMVHQHFMLIPSMTVVQNIIIGSEPTKAHSILNYKIAEKQTQELCKKYHMDIDVNQKVSSLSAGEKQKVEILKTLYRNAEIIILDEPTSVLTPQETETLFEELKQLKKLGHTIIFISHKLNEVKSISDRITVIRNGESKGTYENENLSLNEIAELIVGRKLLSSYDQLKNKVEEKEIVLDVQGVNLVNKNQKILNDISFAIAKGEILGIAGVQGNGQSELVRAIAGIGPMSGGSISLCGNRIDNLDVRHRRHMGLAYIPEDRLVDGVSAVASVSDNIISSYFDREDISGSVFMKRKNINKTAQSLVDDFSIRTKSIQSAVGSLSGGNMQKVVVARENNTNAIFLIAEQPTQGIDIGSSEYIRKRLIELRNGGSAILLVSADLEEVMSLSDKLIVMYDGAIAAYFNSTEDLSRNELGLYMFGVKRQTEEEIEEARYV